VTALQPDSVPAEHGLANYTDALSFKVRPNGISKDNQQFEKKRAGAVPARFVAVLAGAPFFLTVPVGFAQTASGPSAARRRSAHLHHGMN